MKIKALALGGAAALAMITTGFTANAAVVDKPTFKVGGLVVVWGADTDTAGSAKVHDFYLLTSTTATDLIAGDVDGDADFVVTGDLLPTLDGASLDNNSDGVLDASDSLAAFDVTATTDVNAGGASGTNKGQFFVASNTPFEIRAVASETNNDFTGVGLANIAFDMTLENTFGTATPTVDGSALQFGAAAQDPTGAAAGFANIDNLGAMTTSTPVYTAGQRTAASVGGLAAQSVRFNTSYTLDTDLTEAGTQGFDLSLGTGSLEAEVTYTIFTP